MIEIKNLSFSYREHPVLNGLNFSADRGQLVAVLGPNGVGKSTLFRCILGFLRTYIGEILLEGHEIRTLSQHEMARLVAYIPQSGDPVFNYTVRDTVLMGTTGNLNPLQSPGVQEYEIVERVMRELGIYELCDCGIGRISGGERQLVMIARALAQNAKLLVMDEPTANLDYGNQYRVLQRIRALADSGYTVLVSTHNPDHALRFATHILALCKDGSFRTGPIEQALDEKLLSDLYEIPISIRDYETAAGYKRSCVPLL